MLLENNQSALHHSIVYYLPITPRRSVFHSLPNFREVTIIEQGFHISHTQTCFTNFSPGLFTRVTINTIRNEGGKLMELEPMELRSSRL